jgi:hypothetical protein
MNTHDQFAAASEAFAQLRSGTIRISEFSDGVRRQTQLLAALPPRYGEVLQQLLDRLESSALFSEESCSFSQKELLDSLQLWFDKAGAQLPPQ